MSPSARRSSRVARARSTRLGRRHGRVGSRHRRPGDRDTGGGDDDGTTTETTQYAFVIDVTFTNNGRTRKVKGMERLDMLPSAASPLLLFLGVSPTPATPSSWSTPPWCPRARAAASPARPSAPSCTSGPARSTCSPPRTATRTGSESIRSARSGWTSARPPRHRGGAGGRVPPWPRPRSGGGASAHRSSPIS